MALSTLTRALPAACSPAVLPGVPDVLQLAVPHVGHGEDEKVLVRVHTFPKLWNNSWGSEVQGAPRVGQHSGLRWERICSRSLTMGSSELEASKPGSLSRAGVTAKCRGS